LNVEKGKVAKLTFKIEEFQRLLRDKGDTIQSLQRQIERPKIAKQPTDFDTFNETIPFRTSSYSNRASNQGSKFLEVSILAGFYNMNYSTHRYYFIAAENEFV